MIGFGFVSVFDEFDTPVPVPVPVAVAVEGKSDCKVGIAALFDLLVCGRPDLIIEEEEEGEGRFLAFIFIFDILCRKAASRRESLFLRSDPDNS